MFLFLYLVRAPTRARPLVSATTPLLCPAFVRCLFVFVEFALKLNPRLFRRRCILLTLLIHLLNTQPTQFIASPLKIYLKYIRHVLSLRNYSPPRKKRFAQNSQCSWHLLYPPLPLLHHHLLLLLLLLLPPPPLPPQIINNNDLNNPKKNKSTIHHLSPISNKPNQQSK